MAKSAARAESLGRKLGAKIRRRGWPGRLAGPLGSIADTPEGRAVEAASPAGETHLRQVLDASGAGSWAWDAATNAEVWDATFRQQFGFAEDEPATFDTWVARIHPEDRPGLLARLDRMLRTPGDDRWDAEFRILLPDGSVRWMRGFGRSERDGEGRVASIKGVNFDVTEARQAQARLHESDARLRLAAEVAELGMIEINYAAGTATPDARAAELFGLRPDVPVPREAVHHRFHPKDREEVHRRIRDCLNADGSGAFAMEHRVMRPDGTVTWLQVKKQVSFVRSGEARHPATALLVALDVTERKAAEERGRLLTRELAHRSKNLLTLVQAVARQTASRSPQEFLPRFEERLKALAASQDLLMGEGSGGADLRSLARQQLAHFRDLLGERIILAGPPVRLGASAAQALGMAFHELATNAGKYGALAGSGGRVEITWQEDRDRLSITWAERDGPLVTPPLRKGFGGLVIDQMVRSALQAEVRLDYAPEGFSWRMDCPVDGVLDDLARPSVGTQGEGTS